MFESSFENLLYNCATRSQSLVHERLQTLIEVQTMAQNMKRMLSSNF